MYSVIDLLSAKFPKAKGLVIKQVDSYSVEKNGKGVVLQPNVFTSVYLLWHLYQNVQMCNDISIYAFIDILMLTWFLLKNNVLSHLFNKVQLKDWFSSSNKFPCITTCRVREGNDQPRGRGKITVYIRDTHLGQIIEIDRFWGELVHSPFICCLLAWLLWLHSIVCPPLVICFVCSSSSPLLQYAFLKSNINKSVIWLLYSSDSFFWLFYQYQLTAIISCGRSCQWLSIITPTPLPNYNRKGQFFDAPHLLV